MPFANPVMGGGNLARPVMKSPDYVPGVSGWAIFRNGNAEFNNLSIRGTFLGTDFIISAAGIFLYSGTPAAGNLIGSWATAAGADPFGNAYLQGLVIGGAGSQQIVLTQSAGAGAVALLSGAGSELIPSELLQQVGNAGTATEMIQTFLLSATDTGQTSRAAVNVNSGTKNGAVPAGGNLQYYTPAGAVSGMWSWGASGAFGTGSITGAKPATSPATRDGVNYVGTAGQPAFSSGWNIRGAPFQQLWFTMMGLNNDGPAGSGGIVKVSGSLTVPAAAAGTTIFTLPTGYRPANSQSFVGVNNTTLAAVQVNVTAAGAVIFVGNGSTGDHVSFTLWVDLVA